MIRTLLRPAAAAALLALSAAPLAAQPTLPVFVMKNGVVYMQP